MTAHNHAFTEDELEVRRILRHTFLKDGVSRDGLAVILGQLGVWSSDLCPTPQQAALRGYGMQILEDLGINNEAREMALVHAIAQIPPVEAEPEKPRSTE